MNEILRTELIDIARHESLKSYGQVAPLVGLSMDSEDDRVKISHLLEEIARHEEKEGRPMLTAVIIHHGKDNNPGEGFFALAAEFKKFNGTRDSLARTAFWAKEVHLVYESWKE